MKGIKATRWMLLGILAMASQASHAFFVTLDVMALPAAQVTANATMAAASQMTASAHANSEKEQSTATANSAKEILQSIENTKKWIEMATFFAKAPTDWMTAIKTYATIGTGWPKPASSATTESSGALTPKDVETAITNALTTYGAARDIDGDQQRPNTVYEQVLKVRRDEMAQRSKLFDQFQESNRSRAVRMNEIEDLLSRAEYERDFNMVQTLLALEQTRMTSEQSSFDLSRAALAENAAIKRELAALDRQAGFTDLRINDPKDPSTAQRAIPRVSLPR